MGEDNRIHVLIRYDGRGCIHCYDPETDGPVCHLRIKREDWDIILMDVDAWWRMDRRCWKCHNIAGQ